LGADRARSQGRSAGARAAILAALDTHSQLEAIAKAARLQLIT
jgi:hypothetical protein